MRDATIESEMEALLDSGCVCPMDACPCCGEQRMDKLEWNDDDSITCLTCGVTYDLEE